MTEFNLSNEWHEEGDFYYAEDVKEFIKRLKQDLILCMDNIRDATTLKEVETIIFIKIDNRAGDKLI